MKKLKLMVLGGLALTAAFLVAGPAPARAAEAEKASPFQGGRFAGIHENLDFYGVKRATIATLSNTGVLIFAGEGFLDAICPWGGTLGKYSLALDSGANASGLTADSVLLALSPAVYTNTDTTSISNQGGCWSARERAGGPVRFVNGLVGVSNDGAHRVIFYWHKSDGSNPG